MPYYLDSYIGSGTREDPFRPSAFDEDDRASSIDLRPDPSKGQGFAVIKSKLVLPSKAGRFKLGDDKSEKSAALKNVVQHRLALNLSESGMSIADTVAELLIEHARWNPTRWNPIIPTRKGYEIWLGDLLWMGMNIRGGAVGTDDFDGADTGTLGRDLTWTETVGNWENLSSEAHLVTDGGSVGNYARAEFDVGSTDMYTKVEVSGTSNYSEIYVLTRYAAAAQTFYFAAAFNDGANTRNIRKSVAGGESRISGHDTTHAITAGEIIQVEAEGSTIRYKVNGTTILTQTDTSITTGQRGGFGGFNNVVRFDDFEAGAIGTAINLSGPSAVNMALMTVPGSVQTSGAVNIAGPRVNLALGVSSGVVTGGRTLTGPTVNLALLSAPGQVSAGTIFTVEDKEIELGGETDIDISVMDFGYNLTGIIPATYLTSVTWKLNDIGTASFSEVPSDSIAARLLVEGEREVVITFSEYLRTDMEFDSPEMWQGTVETSGAEPGKRNIGCDSLEGWLWKRPVESSSLIYSDVEQFDIGWDLIQKAQNGPNMDLDISASYEASGVHQWLDVNLDEHEFYGDVMNELVQLNNGFDWEIYVDQSGTRQWRPYYPRRGSHLSEIKFEYDPTGSKNIKTFEISKNAGAIATAVISTGGTVGGEKIEGLYEDTAASAKYRRRVQVVSSGSTIDEDTLESEAHKAVNDARDPVLDFKLTVNNRIVNDDGSTDYLLGRIHCGDWCNVDIDDGATQLHGDFRIYTITWNKDETLELSFTNFVLDDTPPPDPPPVFSVDITGTRVNMNIAIIAGSVVTGGLPNPDYGTDIRVWMRQPVGVGSAAYANGGILYLPTRNSDGTIRHYTGGMIDVIATPAYLRGKNTGLPQNGWLILMPWTAPTTNADGSLNTEFIYDASLTAGGASITDQNNGGSLHFGTATDEKGVGDFRLVICGLKTLNGLALMAFGSRKIKLWYYDTTYPVEVFAADYDAVAVAHGLTPGYPRNDSNVRNFMKGNYNSNGVNLRLTSAPYRCQEICLMGGDSHEVGEDGFNLGGARYIRLHGCKTWYLDRKNLTDDHGDAFQIIGGEIDIYVDYCFFGSHCQIAAELQNVGFNTTPPLIGFNAHHVWQADSYSAGNSIGAMFQNGVSGASWDFNFSSIAQGGGYLPNYEGVGDYWKWFGNGYSDDGDMAEYTADSPASFNLPRTYIHQWPAGVNPDTTQHPPSGGRVPGKPNIPLVVGHGSNPANIWRANNPYSTLFTYIATYSALDPILGWT